MAFVLVWVYGPPSGIRLVLSLIVFPSVVMLIAVRVLARMTWTPLRVSRAKRWVGSVFVAVCVLQVVENAHKTTHLECTQEVGGRDPECVEFTRVLGGDSQGALLWVALGGFMLWRIAKPLTPRVTSDEGMSDAGHGQRARKGYERHHDNGWTAFVGEFAGSRFLVGLSRPNGHPYADLGTTLDERQYEELAAAKRASDEHLRAESKHGQCSASCSAWVELHFAAAELDSKTASARIDTDEDNGNDEL